MVLDELVIRDKEGRKRILIGSSQDGRAFIEHYDANGKERIGTGTSPFFMPPYTSFGYTSD